jgi:hypothetical protein
LDAQDELNSMAPADRRAEVTAAFVCVIYVVGVVLAVAAAVATAWQLRA